MSLSKITCVVRDGHQWRISTCTRGFLGWRLGSDRMLSAHDSGSLFMALADNGMSGSFLAVGIDRDALLVRLHEEYQDADELFPAGEKLVLCHRQVVKDGRKMVETVAMRESFAVELFIEASNGGFCGCSFFPEWMGSVAATHKARTGIKLEWPYGFVEKRDGGWGNWESGLESQKGQSLSGPKTSSRGGLLLALSNVLPPQWSSPKRKSRAWRSWAVGVVFVLAFVLWAGANWTSLNGQIEVERGRAISLKRALDYGSTSSGCTIAELTHFLEEVSSEVGSSVIVERISYTSDGGLTISGRGDSPVVARDFLERLGGGEKAAYFTRRRGVDVFRGEVTPPCGR